MPTMPGMIAKGHILEKFDAWIADDTKNRAKQAEQKLRDTKTYPTLMKVLDDLQPSVGLSAGQKRHLENDWLKGWWPKENVEAKVRRGFIEACVLVRKSGKPFVLFWSCAGNTFEVWLAESKHQLTVIWSTPHPPVESPGPFPDKEPLLVVKTPPMDKGAKPEGDGDKNGVVTERLYTTAPMK